MNSVSEFYQKNLVMSVIRLVSKPVFEHDLHYIEMAFKRGYITKEEQKHLETIREESDWSIFFLGFYVFVCNYCKEQKNVFYIYDDESYYYHCVPCLLKRYECYLKK